MNIKKYLKRLKSLELRSGEMYRQHADRLLALQSQMNQLAQFRSEYNAAESQVPALIKDAHCFLVRLDSNLQLLEERIDRQRATVEDCRIQLQIDRSKHRAADILLDRERAEVMRLARTNDVMVANSLHVLVHIAKSRK